jgi:hypothetical protein
MSRQSKNARNRAAAAVVTQMHKNGQKGPAKTGTVHGKKKAWFQLFDTYREYLASLKGKNKQKDAKAKDSGKQFAVAAAEPVAE